VQESSFKLSSANVIFEDEDVIAVSKPAGLPSQATRDPKRRHLLMAVLEYLRLSTAKPYAALHHRLDKDTSGVLILSKSPRANKNLGEQFSRHLAQKTYLAFCAPTKTLAEMPQPNQAWTVINHLKKFSLPNGIQRMKVTRAGGDFAETEFELATDLKPFVSSASWMASLPRGALAIYAKPKTGRMHQIRVHLAEQGLPILGDRLYGRGPSAQAASRVMLHACRLEIQHPTRDLKLDLKAPLPGDFAQFLQT